MQIDHVPAKIDLRVKTKILRTANFVNIVRAALENFDNLSQAVERLLVQFTTAMWSHLSAVKEFLGLSAHDVLLLEEHGEHFFP